MLENRRERHLSNTQADKEIEEFLWTLCCELALVALKDTSAKNNRIRSFLDDIHIGAYVAECLSPRVRQTVNLGSGWEGLF